jgi:peptidoglycan hydrolase CwlO-like protein
MSGYQVSPTNFLLLAAENSELRFQLAETQDQCVELAVDAGELQAEIEALRAQLAEVTDQRDAWQAEAERLSVWAVMRG